MNFIVCPACGSQATYILLLGYTITACSHCYQAHILESNVIVRIDRAKLHGQSSVKRELLLVAFTMQALYENWDIIDVPMGE